MSLAEALASRADLIAALHAEDTDCYRLWHGAMEGRPGLAVDRYGPILLMQTWRDPLDEGEIARIAEAVDALIPGLTPVWNHRARTRSGGEGGGRKNGVVLFAEHHDVTLPDELWGRELGLSYDVNPRHRGIDPLLFLDLRAARRKVKEFGAAEVLNLFAYTSGVGLAAAAGGASSVLNVDFAQSALDVGRNNADKNALTDQVWMREDCLPVMRQLGGLKPGGRGRKTTRMEARSFDLVVLDPPRWAKSPFGAVDVVRDYPSLFKPAVLATKPGGVVLATNHVASVDWEDWTDVLLRCAAKAGREVQDIERIVPEADFPSPDSRWPLKMAWVRV